MLQQCRFAVISDPHIALPHTIWEHPNRFHLVEVSIAALEQILERLSQLDLDFLLLPGDLTQHGEPENHRWLTQRLAQLPYPAYVVPGNHDVPVLQANDTSIGLVDFPSYYQKYGYDNPNQPYYTQEILPGLRLIGLNSNQFDAHGTQVGRLDRPQLAWLEQTLADLGDELVIVMIHHNVVEHLPGQARHVLGQRYMLENAANLRALLRRAGVQLVFTGHLHVQDIAYRRGIYDITTGSLVSYPHPYRVLTLRTDRQGRQWLQIESERVQAVPGWPDLQSRSRQWMADRSPAFIHKLLTHPPFNLAMAEAQALAPSLREFWANIADGDAMFDFPQFPALTQRQFQQFNANPAFIDNWTTLLLKE